MEHWRRNVYVLMVLQFLVVGAMTMIMPFLPLYLKELGITNQSEMQVWSGIIFGINFLSAFIVAPIWGNLADRFGRKIMVLRSGFGMAIIVFFTGLATTPIQLLVLRLLSGTVSGFIPASISLVATNTPKNQVGYALGMLQSGVVAGTIMGPFIGGVLAELVGFRKIFFITAVVIGVASVLALYMVKEEVKPKKKNHETKFWKESSTIFKIKPLLALFMVSMFMQFALMGPVAQMSFFVTELGAPGGYIAFFAGLVFAFTGIGNMIFSPIFGRLGDRIGTEKVFLFSLIGAALFFIPHSFVHSIWQLLIVRLFLGVCMGGLNPSLHSLTRKYAPDGKESTVFGYNTSAICLGSMLGPTTYGFLSNFLGIRGTFFITAILLLLVAFILFRFLKSSNINKMQPYAR